MTKPIAILGSTGSIGRSALGVAARHPDRLRIVALAAGDNVELLAQQIQQFKPETVSVRSAEAAARLRELVGVDGPRIGCGEEGVNAVATHPQAQMVLSAIVGAAGLVPTWRAIAAGKDIALANKETLVMAGSLIVKAVKEHNVRLLPVDSEHAAIMQSLEGHQHGEVRRIVLTASGGPFRQWEQERIARAGKADALAHPTWNMGPKITIDSATLMNKGLEVIEARWLFDVAPAQIDVIIHTESIIHSMVEFHDGQVVAQLGVPDMAAPIAYALTYPNRLLDVVQRLDLVKIGRLNFFAVDRVKFPCLEMAYRALALNELAPAILNAANEVAVQAFLAEKIGFYDISQTIEKVLKMEPGGPATDLETVLAADRRARAAAATIVGRLAQEKNEAW
mgnify:FL=1